MATIGACALFAAASASSIATAVTMGMVALPEMKEYKYDSGLATGCIAAGGTLGILIPPSGILIVYGIITEQSIGELFVAGIIPGIILAQFTIVTALAIRLLKSTFDSIDPRYEQVGRTLGCTKLKAFCTVTLPLAKNGLIAAAILTWARAIGEFGATVTLAGATKQKTETLPIAIFLNLATADVEKAVAVIFILIAISVVALIFLRRISSTRYPR